MRNMSENRDETAVKRQHSRYIELAAMFKEHMKGSDHLKEIILGKFCLQEGLKITKAKEYYSLLCTTGLIKLTNGHKSWKYDPKMEWENFHVEI